MTEQYGNWKPADPPPLTGRSLDDHAAAARRSPRLTRLPTNDVSWYQPAAVSDAVYAAIEKRMEEERARMLAEATLTGRTSIAADGVSAALSWIDELPGWLDEIPRRPGPPRSVPPPDHHAWDNVDDVGPLGMAALAVVLGVAAAAGAVVALIRRARR